MPAFGASKFAAPDVNRFACRVDVGYLALSLGLIKVVEELEHDGVTSLGLQAPLAIRAARHACRHARAVLCLALPDQFQDALSDISEHGRERAIR